MKLGDRALEVHDIILYFCGFEIVQNNKYKHIHILVYVCVCSHKKDYLKKNHTCIHILACVCVCVCVCTATKKTTYTHTHTHTHH